MQVFAFPSIPRFKHTGEVKGFAFVEFETSKQAKEAIQVIEKDFDVATLVSLFVSLKSNFQPWAQ